MRRYIHVCTPTDGRPVRRSPWSQLGSNITRDRPVRGVSIRQTHTRGFHPCYYLAARPHLVNSAHLYEHTHTYTSYMFAYESWLEVLIYGGGNKRKRVRKIEIRRGDDWLMTTYICTLYYPPGDTHDLPHSVLLPSGLSEERYNPSSETYSSTSRVCVLPI